MFKKIISIILTVAVVCSLVVPAVYADEPDCLTNGHSFSDPTGIMKGFDGEIQGFPVKVSIKYCSKCKFYFHECNVLGIKLEYMSLTGFTGIDGELQAFLFTQIGRIMGSNASASQFQAGGGSASPGGVGRNPSGYSGQGKPNINSNGICLLSCPITGVWEFYAGSSGYSISWISEDYFSNYTKDLPKKTFYAGGSDDVPEYGYIYCTFTAPVDGIYFFGNLVNGYSYCDFTLYRNFSSPISGSVTLNFSQDQPYNYVKHFNKGDIAYLKFGFDYHDHCDTSQISSSHPLTSLKFQFNPILLCVEPDPTDTSISNQTNITINNNTWIGNIYVDSSNKLTYIYPQYTVNNETKISNNPIIYNEETKQYYTYDSVTNNYYYITYGDPAPTPTPSPSPDPGGSTPDPDKPSPTPAPTPGGSSGGSDSSGGGSGFNPFKWLADLLKDIVEGIFKAVWKLITSIFGFLIWLVSLLGNVLPFLPSESLAALSAAAIIITVIRIIKFILGR